MSAQALHARIAPALVRVLRDLLGLALAHRLRTGGPAPVLLARFAGVYVHDATTVALPVSPAAVSPGCGGSAPVPPRPRVSGTSGSRSPAAARPRSS